MNKQNELVWFGISLWELGDAGACDEIVYFVVKASCLIHSCLSEMKMTWSVTDFQDRQHQALLRGLTYIFAQFSEYKTSLESWTALTRQ